MKWIEFIGVPGSGKTSLCRILVQIFKQSDRNVYNINDLKVLYIKKKFKLSILQYIVPQFISSFIYMKLFNFLKIRFKLISKYKNENSEEYNSLNNLIEKCVHNKDHLELVKKWTLSTIIYHQMASPLLKDDDIIAVSEGFIHRTISIFSDVAGNDNLPQLLNSYLTLAPEIHLLINVKENINHCLEINSVRTRLIRISNLSKAERKNHILKTSAIKQKTVKAAFLYKYNIWDIDNTRIYKNPKRWKSAMEIKLKELVNI